MYHQKGIFEKNKDTTKTYNMFSPPTMKPKHYINNSNIKFKPINLNSKCFSPGQNDKNFSVNMINSPEVKLNMDMLGQYSSIQKNLNAKLFQSPDTNNSDLLTASTFSPQQQSNESMLSISTNSSQYIPSNFQVLMPSNYTLYQYPCHRKIFSMGGTQMNYFYNSNMMGNNNIINTTNPIKVNLKTNNQYGKNKKPIQNIYSSNLNQNLRSSYDCNNCNKFNEKNKNINSNDSVKSGGSGGNSDTSKGATSNNSGKNENKNNVGKKKNYFNKFNSPKENSTNENTVILTLKIKVAPNDFRVFNLKKYDDLFVSLEKFFDLNKIKQELVKPIVTKIFAALNKIFWLLNNKIGIYDQEYLNSLHKLWIKNKERLPKRNDKVEDKKINNNENNNNHPKNKNIISDDNSTISSSDSSNKNKKHIKLKSNSFQNLDNSSDNDRQDTAKSI